MELELFATELHETMRDDADHFLYVDQNGVAWFVTCDDIDPEGRYELI